MTGEQADGAFAEYILCRAAGVLRLPEGLSPRHAALAEPLSVALHGITRSGVAPGDSVMVFGAGPIGALSVAALHAMGIDDITVVEPHKGRRQLAADLGVTAIVDPEDLEVFPSWEPERMSSRAVDVVLECSGHRAAIEAGFSQLARGGMLVMVGAGIDHPHVRHQPHDPQRAHRDRFLRLRPGWLRAGARAAGVRRASRRTS